MAAALPLTCLLWCWLLCVRMTSTQEWPRLGRDLLQDLDPEAQTVGWHLHNRSVPHGIRRWRRSIGSTDVLTDSECLVLRRPSAAAMQCGLDTLSRSSVGQRGGRSVLVRVATPGVFAWQDAIRRIGCSIPEAGIHAFRDQCRIVFGPSCRHRRPTTSDVEFHFYGGLGSKCEGG